MLAVGVTGGTAGHGCLLRDMADEGLPITEEVLKTLSPYRTSHINRLGDYALNLSRQVI